MFISKVPMDHSTIVCNLGILCHQKTHQRDNSSRPIYIQRKLRGNASQEPRISSILHDTKSGRIPMCICSTLVMHTHVVICPCRLLCACEYKWNYSCCKFFSQIRTLSHIMDCWIISQFAFCFRSSNIKSSLKCHKIQSANNHFVSMNEHNIFD